MTTALYQSRSSTTSSFFSRSSNGAYSKHNSKNSSSTTHSNAVFSPTATRPNPKPSFSSNTSSWSPKRIASPSSIRPDGSSSPTPPTRRRRSNSAAPFTNYSGPLFTNAPEPSSLPLPFAKQSRTRSASFNNHHHHHHHHHHLRQERGKRRPISHSHLSTHCLPEEDQQEMSVIEIQQSIHSLLKLGQAN